MKGRTIFSDRSWLDKKLRMGAGRDPPQIGKPKNKVLSPDRSGVASSGRRSSLSHHLLTHPNWRGAAETLVLLMAVFTVWAHTSWSATIIPADRSRTLWMVLPVMLLGLFMNAALPEAFAGSAWLFVVPLLMINLGRTVWTILSARKAGLYHEHYIRVLIWFVIVTPLWIAGALASPEARLAWWAGAAGVEIVSTSFGHPEPGRRLVNSSPPQPRMRTGRAYMQKPSEQHAG